MLNQTRLIRKIILFYTFTDIAKSTQKYQPTNLGMKMFNNL